MISQCDQESAVKGIDYLGEFEGHNGERACSTRLETIRLSLAPKSINTCMGRSSHDHGER